MTLHIVRKTVSIISSDPSIKEFQIRFKKYMSVKYAINLLTVSFNTKTYNNKNKFCPIYLDHINIQHSYLLRNIAGESYLRSYARPPPPGTPQRSPRPQHSPHSPATTPQGGSPGGRSFLQPSGILFCH